MRLFIERGFEATTLDDIAEAAFLSRRTLFHYFESKEEIVLSHTAEFPDAIAEAVAHRAADVPLLDMAEAALVEMITRYQSRWKALRVGKACVSTCRSRWTTYH